ncbi:hypothetical protein [Nocardia neocaledoniensis]|uniref:hypothetical protein n=1 Tax=Nocardia neocaledoniensis TaxID=236511 RepID=UPI002458BC19|nr:hypothetical protein [Nocardia neocaledoniensis]
MSADIRLPVPGACGLTYRPTRLPAADSTPTGLDAAARGCDQVVLPIRVVGSAHYRHHAAAHHRVSPTAGIRSAVGRRRSDYGACTMTIRQEWNR